MARLRIVASAKQDLSDIFDFIARDKPIAAANWVDKIQEKCELISETPEFGEVRPEYGPEIRSSTLGRYVIFYRPIGNGIEVLRIIVGDRDIQSL